MSQPTAFHEGFRELYDLTGNDRVTREVAVVSVDPQASVPAQVLEGRPDPTKVLPVSDAADGPITFAPTLLVEPGATIEQKGSLAEPTILKGNSTIVASAEKEPAPQGTTQRGDDPHPADAGLVNHVLRVVEGRTCLLGNDAREPEGGGNLAWAESLDGKRTPIRTQIRQALAPMQQGTGAAISERVETGIGGAGTPDDGSRPGDPAAQGGAGGAGGSGDWNGKLSKTLSELADAQQKLADTRREYDAAQHAYLQDSSSNEDRLDAAKSRYNSAKNGYTHAAAAVREMTDGMPTETRTIALGLPGAEDSNPFGMYLDDSGNVVIPVGLDNVNDNPFGSYTDEDGNTVIPVGIQDGGTDVGVGTPFGPFDAVFGSQKVKDQIMAARTALFSQDISDEELVQRLATTDQGLLIGAEGQWIARGELPPDIVAQRSALGRGAGGAGGAGGAPSGPVTGVRLDVLFGEYNGDGYPLAFNAPLSEAAHDLFSGGERWAAGYFAQMGAAWRPVVPIPHTVPPSSPPKPDPPPKPPTGKKGPPRIPTPDPGDPDQPQMPGDDFGDPEGDGGADGLPKVPGDGELTPCDEAPDPGDDPTTIIIRDPKTGLPTGVLHPATGQIDAVAGANEADAYAAYGDGGDAIDAIAAATAPGAVAAPGTAATRADPRAGRSVLRPRTPLLDAEGDERQRLGGGPYMRGAPLTPRGGVRLTDAHDFTWRHSVWDVLNHVIDKQNQIISIMNERFPFAPDVIRGAGLKLPAQALEKVRLEQFDPGTVVQVRVKTPRGTRLSIPHAVIRDRRGQKRLVPIGADHAPERVVGLSDTEEDVLLRFDSGRGKRRDKSDLPTIGYRQRRRGFVIEGAPVEVVADLSVVQADGTVVPIGKSAPAPNAVPRADASGKLDRGWLPAVKPIASRAFLKANVSIPSGVETPLKWDGVDFNLTTNREAGPQGDGIIVSEAGVYLAVAAARWQGGVIGTNFNAGNRAILLYLNGTLVQQEHQSPAFASLLTDVNMHITAILNLSSGDSVRASVLHTQGQAIQLRGGTAADSSLAVTLVQRTT